MKLAIIYFGFNNPATGKRGVENVISIQAQALSAGSRKYYIFFDRTPSVSRWDSIISIGLKYDALRFLALNLLIGKLRRRLKRLGYRVVVHSHNYLFTLLLWWKSDLFSVHDGLWYQKKMVGSRIPWFFYLVEICVYWRSKHLHCNSRFTFDNSLLPKADKPAVTIHCSTPLERYRVEATRSPLRFIGRESSLVFSVRSMEPRARIDVILDAAAIALKRGHPLHFVIAGKGPLLDFYRLEISRRELTNIELLGYVTDADLARRYAGCDMVIMLCEYGEGFGIPAIEGYLFGKPVIGSNRCAIPEVVISQSYLVENDAARVVDLLMTIRTSAATPEQITAYYDSHFSNHVIIGKFEKLYQATVSSPLAAPNNSESHFS